MYYFLKYILVFLNFMFHLWKINKNTWSSFQGRFLKEIGYFSFHVRGPSEFFLGKMFFVSWRYNFAYYGNVHVCAFRLEFLPGRPLIPRLRVIGPFWHILSIPIQDFENREPVCFWTKRGTTVLGGSWRGID